MWAALIYAVLGTFFTHWIGKPLVALNFTKQRFEADFRFNLVRVRENSEQIALLRGDEAERQRLLERFGRVVGNWLQIMTRTKRLTAFTASYSQASVVFPFILVAPAYFAEKMQLGGMMQTASAFGSVQGALSFFISTYRTLAEWRAVVRGSTASRRRSQRASELATRNDMDSASTPSPAATRSTSRSWRCSCPTASRWSTANGFRFSAASACW